MKLRYRKPQEIAVRYGKSARTIRDWITHGCPSGGSVIHLPAMKAGKGWLISEHDLEFFDLRLKQASPRLELE